MSGLTEVVLETVALRVEDGTQMRGHLARPMVRGAGLPGILVFQEAFGVNDYLRSVTARFAELGFVALAPELYHRSGDGVVGSYDGGRDEMMPYSKAVTTAGIVADVIAAYSFLARETDADRGIAAVGFCFGGRVAYLANAHVPLKAAISFYGGRMPAWFDFVDRQAAPLLCFWGRRDASIPLSEVRTVADRFDEAGLDHTQVVFSRAGHGFFRHVRDDVYDPEAARIAWDASLAFLRNAHVLR
jgi:carboxymethylenebutenolidase